MTAYRKDTSIKALEQMRPEEKKEYFRSRGTVVHWWNPLESRYKYHFESEFKAIQDYALPRPGERVLEIGPGRGLFTIWYAQLGCSVTALDISSEMLAIAKENAKTANVEGTIEFVLGDGEDLSQFVPESYDWVICMNTFDHIPNHAKAIAQMADRLKPGGCLLLTYCPKGSLHGILFQLYKALISRFYKLNTESGLVARPYDWHEIGPHLEENGVVVERRYGIGLLCLLLREEFELGILTALPRALSKFEESIRPFYTSRFLAGRSQTVVCMGRKQDATSS